MIKVMIGRIKGLIELIKRIGNRNLRGHQLSMIVNKRCDGDIRNICWDEMDDQNGMIIISENEPEGVNWR